MRHRQNQRASSLLAVLVIGTVFWLAGINSIHAAPKPPAKRPHLKFCILANERDDAKALAAAKKHFAAAAEDAKLKAELKRRAEDGKPPAAVKVATDKAPGYTWVEIAPACLRYLRLDNASAEDAKPLDPGLDTPRDTTPHNAFWKEVATARDKGTPLLMARSLPACLLYSRSCQNRKLSKEARERKKFEYFLLTRDPQPGKALTGKHLASARAGMDSRGTPCINFELTTKGGELMAELSSHNLPSRDEEFFVRYLAIILDEQIVTAPSLRSKIGTQGQIGGSFTRPEIDAIVTVLRGDLPPEKK
ncbi:MAG TPA: hypothetical protein VN688_22165 [Gemmataceae bacterium]|nr:hypothetical protein [Gemmataceae bacterium]